MIWSADRRPDLAPNNIRSRRIRSRFGGLRMKPSASWLDHASFSLRSVRAQSFPARATPAFLNGPLGLDLGDQPAAAGAWDIERSLLFLANAGLRCTDVEMVGSP